METPGPSDIASVMEARNALIDQTLAYVTISLRERGAVLHMPGVPLPVTDADSCRAQLETLSTSALLNVRNLFPAAANPTLAPRDIVPS
ncbi:MAG: hypothetical protein PHW10_04150 [Candidatus Peribacteraceae bacterium]|nr:hypothetical protein [Candidatus Peribacteraceae bacterium]